MKLSALYYLQEKDLTPLISVAEGQTHPSASREIRRSCVRQRNPEKCTKLFTIKIRHLRRTVRRKNCVQENQDLVEECRKKVCWREACLEKIGSGSAFASKPPAGGEGLVLGDGA